MPINPRLLRPTSSTLDRDAAVYLNAVAAADQQQLEPAVRKAINDFVIGCKRDGIWDAIKASCILMGARTLSGALVPLKGSAPTNNGPFVSGDYDRKTGLKGNGTSKYLNSNRNTNADGQDNQHLSAYVSALQTSGTFAIYIGQGTPSTSVDSLVGRSGITPANLFVRSRNVSGQNDAGTGLGGTAGFVGISRSGSGSYDVRGAGSTATITRASSVPPSENIGVFTRLPQVDALTDARIAFYSIGEALTLSALDTRVSALYTAIGAAI
jgi:hypothetical protein